MLAEIYEALADNESASGQRLVNLSTRGVVGANNAILIGGFVIKGNASKRVLIRGVGPGLAAFGVPQTLSDPEIELFASDNTSLLRNDNWESGGNAAELSAAAVAAGAFALQAGSRDAAILRVLPPGAYTIHVRGVSGATGAVLFEVYEAP